MDARLHILTIQKAFVKNNVYMYVLMWIVEAESQHFVVT